VALQRHSEGILESSPAGIAVLAPDDVVITANLAFAALVGRPRAELLGRPLASLLDLGKLPAPGAAARQVRCADALGRERHLEMSVAALQDESEAGRRVFVLQDVTDRVAMEEALKEKDRLASLGVLAAGVAHEVNTPLTGISSYAQLLLSETGVDDPRRPLLEKVEKQTFRASRIVANLLEFARKPGVERRPVDLGALIQETTELLRERFSSRRIELDWQRPEESHRVVGSEGELQQVFTNLMLNAVDAMAANGGRRLAVRIDAADGIERVHVDDDGPGIPEEARAAVFQPFFTTKRGSGGTGLGLSISQSIVDQHGGRIDFANLSPRGCRFTVELPAAPDGTTVS
jgi:two-component system NtrC family sensor kinase